MEFRKDSEVAEWALSGASSLGRDLKHWERQALKRKMGSLIRTAGELENLASSPTASSKLAEARQAAARKYRQQAKDLKKIMKRFGIREEKKVKINEHQLRKLIREEIKNN